MVQLSSIAGLLSVIPLAHAAAAVKAAGLAPAAEKVARSRDLFDFETVQLTDSILEKLSNQVPDVSIFSFRTKAPPSAKLMRRSGACKTYPGDAAWPSDEVWNLFDTLLGGALIRTVPDTAICYSNWNVYDASACQNLTSNYANSYLRIEDPTAIRAVLYQGLTCLPPSLSPVSFLGYSEPGCTLGGFPQFSVNVTNVAQIQLAVNIARELNLRLVIKNTGHDFGAKSTGMGALNIWTHHLKDHKFYEKFNASSYTGPAIKLGAGIQVFEANKIAKDYGVTLVGGEGETVGVVGGYVQGGGHSPLTSLWGMAADQVLSMEIVTADGRFITADAENNPDIFWAVRGGGGSTYGVVTSMVMKAYPKITVTTMMYNMSTDANFTNSQFWIAQRAWIDNFATYADKGFYAYGKIRHVGGETVTNYTWVAPNITEKEFRAIVAPLFEKWASLGVPFNPVIRQYDNYHDAWRDGFPLEGWSIGMRQASRLIPRENLVDESKKNATIEAIESVFNDGANLILFNIRNPPGSENIDNAVHPLWRKVVMFALMFVTWDTNVSPEYATEISRNLTFEWNPRWRAITPGGGTYMSESDYIEPDRPRSFHGDKYPRLYDIKQKWDPDGVFYAQNAVGSEDWQMSGMLMGHLPSQNSRLCRK